MTFENRLNYRNYELTNEEIREHLTNIYEKMRELWEEIFNIKRRID